MAWAAMVDIFNAKPSTKKQVVEEESTFASIIRDLQQCGMRNRSEEISSSVEKGPRPNMKNRPSRCDSIQQVPQDCLDSGEDRLAEDHHDLGPFSRSLPHGVTKRLARLVAQQDPYILREIAERASGSLRLQFLKQCQTGNKERCGQIWVDLSERERRDLYRACQHTKGTSHAVFQSILEEDAPTDCGESSLGDYDEWSEYASTGSRPGSSQSVSPAAPPAMPHFMLPDAMLDYDHK